MEAATMAVGITEEGITEEAPISELGSDSVSPLDRPIHLPIHTIIRLRITRRIRMHIRPRCTCSQPPLTLNRFRHRSNTTILLHLRQRLQQHHRHPLHRHLPPGEAIAGTNNHSHS